MHIFRVVALQLMQETTFTFSYLIKDSWDNVPQQTTLRRVHIYESEQLPGYAFYATPIVNGAELAAYYDTNGTSDNFLSSIRKDYDGDGVSDFWEVVLNEENQNPHLDLVMLIQIGISLKTLMLLLPHLLESKLQLVVNKFGSIHFLIFETE